MASCPEAVLTVWMRNRIVEYWNEEQGPDSMLHTLESTAFWALVSWSVTCRRGRQKGVSLICSDCSEKRIGTNRKELTELSPELGEDEETRWVRCLKLYCSEPYSARFRFLAARFGLNPQYFGEEYRNTNGRVHCNANEGFGRYFPILMAQGCRMYCSVCYLEVHSLPWHFTNPCSTPPPTRNNL